MRVRDAPVPAPQLHGLGAAIFDHDVIGPDEMVMLRRRLVVEIDWVNAHRNLPRRRAVFGLGRHAGLLDCCRSLSQNGTVCDASSIGCATCLLMPLWSLGAEIGAGISAAGRLQKSWPIKDMSHAEG